MILRPYQSTASEAIFKEWQENDSTLVVKLQVVCNCGVLAEGFDDPSVEVVIMGHPTKSRSLYSQMVGRW